MNKHLATVVKENFLLLTGSNLDQNWALGWQAASTRDTINPYELLTLYN